jgi:glycosyltransferase involved in cell wall biosynthesis
MNQVMHIVQLIDLLDIGGAQKLLVTFAEALQGSEHRLTVVSLQPIRENTFNDQLRALNVPIVTFPANKLFDLPRLRRVVQFLRRERVDVVHTHLAYANIIGNIAGRLTGVAVVSSLHNISPGKHALRARIEAWLLVHAARRVIGVGEIVAAAHRERLRGQTIVPIPNAVAEVPPLPPDGREALRRELAGDPSRPIVLAVGRLTEQKGYPDMIAAFAEVQCVHPHALLVIAGSGGLHDQLAAQIAAAGLDQQVELLGPRSDVPQLLAASDLFVSSSWWEGLPVAVLEAMAAGLPVVATSVGDVPQVVVAGTGLVVPPRDPQALAAALRSLLENRAHAQALGQAARDHIARHYSPAAWVDQILEIYRAVQPGPPASSRTIKEAR